MATETKSKLQAVRKTSTTVSTMTQEKKQEVPKDAKIRSQTIRTETEQIENGYLITKSYDGTYYTGKADNDYNWFNYSKKWFSEEDPLTIQLNDKSLSDAFKEEEIK